MTASAYLICSVLQGIFSIVAGKLSDKFGARIVVSVCGLLAGSGYILMSKVTSLWQIYLFYGVFIGIGLGGISVPVLSTVLRWFEKRKGLATGIALSGSGAGIVIMPPVSSQLIAVFNWRNSYIIIGVIVIILVVGMAQFLKREPKTSSPNVPQMNSSMKIPGFTFSQALCTVQFWGIWAMFFCGSYCMNTALVHIVPYATDAGISSTRAATILSAIGIVSIGAKLVIGNLGDKIGNIKANIIALFLLCLSFIWLLFSTELWMFYIFACIFGVAYGGYAALQSPLIAEFFKLRAHGTIFGLAMFGAFSGGGLGSLVAGEVFDVNGSYSPAFIVCAIIGMISLAFAIYLTASRRSSTSY
jgi:MFS family permease